jgi:hypothetical protein
VQDLERIRYVTRNYERLQGLKLLPIWMALLASTLFQEALRLIFPQGMDNPYRTFAATFAYAFFLLLFIAAILLYIWFEDYYARKFGRVGRGPSARRDRFKVLAFVVLVIVVVVVSFFAARADAFGRSPLLVGWLALGAGWIIAGWPHRRFQMHYIVVGLLLLGLSFSLLLGFLRIDTTQESNLFTAVLSASCIVNSICDHLLLVRTMKHLPEEDDGGAV